ncbi:uncharacterized protein PG986_004925 [Apiospora aurea]|uniref:Uncharacterized protein n=1 Tax=Apiospora aurea TaxID=335848 RepID=A0ABR1QG34_9PEZI
MGCMLSGMLPDAYRFARDDPHATTPTRRLDVGVDLPLWFRAVGLLPAGGPWSHNPDLARSLDEHVGPHYTLGQGMVEDRPPRAFSDSGEGLSGAVFLAILGPQGRLWFICAGGLVASGSDAGNTPDRHKARAPAAELAAAAHLSPVSPAK